MAIRCYIPTTLTALRSGLADVRAVTPDAQGRSLRGEESETAEFHAMSIAALLAANAAFDRPTGEAVPEARVVVAYDAPESSPRESLTEGFELLGLEQVDMNAVASFHLDEDTVWDEAVQLAREHGPSAAEDRLGESDLLWYDATELPQLLAKRD
ncbi:DUF6912 family protein [Brevibacterium renqingii]|uniref:DUF6912 family protein n=1 Tax=Brevibacterium renqingii TaxID=2776916 RepID=UPI001AE0A882|nr:hypothetical protein [Brevibacterium renqingii]